MARISTCDVIIGGCVGGGGGMNGVNGDEKSLIIGGLQSMGSGDGGSLGNGRGGVS